MFPVNLEIVVESEEDIRNMELDLPPGDIRNNPRVVMTFYRLSRIYPCQEIKGWTIIVSDGCELYCPYPVEEVRILLDNCHLVQAN